MMQTLSISDGAMVFEDGKRIGQVFIINKDGTTQMHSEHFGASAIKIYRFLKGWLKDKHNITTGCNETDKKVRRLLLMLGFKEIGYKEPVLVFRKD